MNARRLLAGLTTFLAALAWAALLVLGPLYLSLTGPQVYRRVAHDRRLLPRLSAVLAVELAPRLPQDDTYRWMPRQAETLQPVLEAALQPETLEPLLAHLGPQTVRWFLGQGPAPEAFSAAVRAYLIEPRRALILDALWQALPPCAEAGALYCRPDQLPPEEQGYAYTALREAWDTIEMDVYARLNTWQARAFQTPPLPVAPALVLIWPFLALALTAAVLALAPAQETPLWAGFPPLLGGLGAAALAWYLPAWAGHWMALWGLEGFSATVQGYALTLAQVVLEAAAWNLFAAAALALALAALVWAWGGVWPRLRPVWMTVAALLALVMVALLVWLAQAPTGATPQPTPTLWPTPTITLTPTATPYWPVQPGTPVPTPMGGFSLTQPPQVVGCLQAQHEPVHALGMTLQRLTIVQSSATTLADAQTLSPTAVLTQPLMAERALLAWEEQVVLVQGTRARHYLLPDFTEVYTTHIPILSPIRAVAVLPQRLQILLGLDEGRIWIVDASSGDADWSLWNIERHTAPITVLATHPSRPWVASGAANGELWLWDVEAGTRLKVLDGHRAALTALAFSPNGQQLLAADASGQILLWDVTRAEVVQRWQLAGDAVTAMAWEQELPVAGTRQGRLVLVAGDTLWTSAPQSAAVTALDIHANRIAVGTEDGRVCLWTQVRP